jgi:hypothetical protein
MTIKGRALRHGVSKGSRLPALIGVAVMFLPSLATCAADLPGILGILGTSYLIIGKSQEISKMSPEFLNTFIT